MLKYSRVEKSRGPTDWPTDRKLNTVRPCSRAASMAEKCSGLQKNNISALRLSVLLRLLDWFTEALLPKVHRCSTFDFFMVCWLPQLINRRNPMNSSHNHTEGALCSLLWPLINTGSHIQSHIRPTDIITVFREAEPVLLSHWTPESPSASGKLSLPSDGWGVNILFWILQTFPLQQRSSYSVCTQWEWWDLYSGWICM